MLHSLIMSDNYLLALAKNIGIFVNSKSLIQFLSLWYRMKKYHLGILAYLQNILLSNTNTVFNLEQKTAFKAAQALKK